MNIAWEWEKAEAVPQTNEYIAEMVPPSSSDVALQKLQEGIPKFLSVPFLGEALKQFDCWVAGGSIINFLCGREISYNDKTRADNEQRCDIDLFCTKEHLPKLLHFFNWKIYSVYETKRAILYDTGNHLIHLVKITWPSPYDTINDFDIRAAACAITKSEVFTVNGALEDIVNKEIKVRHEHVTNSGRTFYRMLKYMHAKKFKADVNEFIRIAEGKLLNELLGEKEETKVEADKWEAAAMKEVDKWEAYELTLQSLENNKRLYPILQEVLNEIQKTKLLAERSF